MHDDLARYAAADPLADVCVIGAGAAGLSLALRLARRGRHVLLCEGGEQDFTLRSQALYEGAVAGDPYIPLDAARLRYFGGSTNHWGGMCRPLDAYDFTAKPADEGTAWPIDRDALAPYYADAAAILGVSPIPPDATIPGLALKRVHFSIGPATRLKETCADEVARSPQLHYCPNANLFGLETRDGRITAAVFKDYTGGEYRVRARQFVLACGGIENSRLLLWCNRRSHGQVVKQPATLGRYWMDHPHATLGRAIILEPAALGLDASQSVFLAPSPAMLAEHRILNCGLRLHRMSDTETGELVEQLTLAAPRLGEWIKQRPLAANGCCGVVLRAAWEQQPHPESRVELADGDLDALGMPRSRLVWRKTALDHHTVRDCALTLGDYLRRRDIGRVRLDPWLTDDTLQFPADGELAGRHHMGGTRMAESPEHGVVDRDCRVFGQDNLYIGGSSVFPSSGHANPTLTLVQLAMRLADHLDARLA
ncbi:FAD-dependent oxidoreductase [Modicisalibacter coralii]|uniref:FAD-dependent oxidoreductase n=1 Tax=Modicisalibacter coralii TaxID=2304602 RepID=UPI00100B9DDD|nr:GMC family oxidoreductase [Halomonas coralii]